MNDELLASRQECAAAPVVSGEALVSGLRALGVEPGDLVLVSGSQADPTRFEGGAAGIVDALLAAVGPAGTIAMHAGRHVFDRPRPLFDPRRSPSEMGPLSDCFWQRPQARRSADPFGSVAAIGPLAEELTGTHDGDELRDSPWGDRAFGQMSPWQRLYDRNARLILLEDDFDSLALFRLAQVLYMEPLRGRYAPDVVLPDFDRGLMGTMLDKEGLVTTVSLGPVVLRGLCCRDLVDRSLALFRQDPLRFFPAGSQDRFGFKAWHERIPFMEERLRAGLARVRITPEQLYGFRGVHRDLWARALVLQDREMTIGLVCADQLGVSRYQVQEARRRVQQRCGLPAENLMIAANHVHTEPRLDHGESIPEYIQAVVDGVVEAVCQAAENLQPVRIGTATVETDGIVVSRRIKLLDGSVSTSRYSVPSSWYISPDLIDGYGPIDPRLTTLCIEDLKGRVLGVVGNLTGHPLAAFRSKYISGDCFGHAEDLMELVYPGSVAMLTNGCEGNSIARGSIPERGPRYDRQAERLGQMIGGYWLKAVASANPTDGGSVGARRRDVELALDDYWKSLVKQGVDIVALAPGTLRRAETDRLQDGQLLTEVQALRIDDAVLVSMPGEAFVEGQLTIKQHSSFPCTVVLGLANDYAGYLPARAAFAEGGYEVNDRATPLLITEDALGTLCTTALELIAELWHEFSGQGAS